MPSARSQRPLAEQHEDWTAHLRRQVVSRRIVVCGAVGAAAGSLLLGSTGGTCPSARTRPPRCGPAAS